MGRPTALGVRRPQHFVTLIPDAGGFVATFYDEELHVPVTDGGWGMVRSRVGRTWVDDEDEFAEHRHRYGYPDEVVRAASASCDAVLCAVAGRRGPYDGRCAPARISRPCDQPVA